MAKSDKDFDPKDLDKIRAKRAAEEDTQVKQQEIAFQLFIASMKKIKQLSDELEKDMKGSVIPGDFQTKRKALQDEYNKWPNIPDKSVKIDEATAAGIMSRAGRLLLNLSNTSQSEVKVETQVAQSVTSPENRVKPTVARPHLVTIEKQSPSSRTITWNQDEVQVIEPPQAQVFKQKTPPRPTRPAPSRPVTPAVTGRHKDYPEVNPDEKHSAGAEVEEFNRRSKKEIHLKKQEQEDAAFARRLAQEPDTSGDEALARKLQAEEKREIQQPKSDHRDEFFAQYLGLLETIQKEKRPETKAESETLDALEQFLGKEAIKQASDIVEPRARKEANIDFAKANPDKEDYGSAPQRRLRR